MEKNPEVPKDLKDVKVFEKVIISYHKSVWKEKAMKRHEKSFKKGLWFYWCKRHVSSCLGISSEIYMSDFFSLCILDTN